MDGVVVEARRYSQLGDWSGLPAPDGVVAYARTAPGDRRLVLVNFTGAATAVAVEGRWAVEVASDGAGQGARYAGRLAPDQAVVLRPA